MAEFKASGNLSPANSAAPGAGINLSYTIEWSESVN